MALSDAERRARHVIAQRKYRQTEKGRAAERRYHRSGWFREAVWRSNMRLRPIRRARWHAEFIPCRNHPDRRCNLAKYVHSGHRLCGSCKGRLASGERRGAYLRYVRSEQRHWKEKGRRRYHKIQEGKI